MLESHQHHRPPCLNNEDGTYPKPASYFKDNTRAARKFGDRNLWHAHRVFFLDQRIYKKAELCCYHGNVFNLKREGQNIILSLSVYLEDYIRHCLIGYMRDAQEKAKERILPYSKLNKFLFNQYGSYKSHWVKLINKTLENTKMNKDRWLGVMMLKAKPNLDNLGYV